MTVLRKYSPEIHGAILGAMRAGAGFPRACIIAGISQPTGRAWLALGRSDEDAPTAQLAREVDAIVADRLAKLESIALNAALEDGDVKAAQWLLERLLPAEYSSRSQMEHVVQEQPAHRIIDASVTVAQLEAQLEELDQ